MSFKDETAIRDCWMIGQEIEINRAVSTLKIGEIQVQMLRLPPLPGIPMDQPPQRIVIVS